LIDTFKSLHQQTYTNPLAFNIPHKQTKKEKKKKKKAAKTKKFRQPTLPLASAYLFSTATTYLPNKKSSYRKQTKPC